MLASKMKFSQQKPESHLPSNQGNIIYADSQNFNCFLILILIPQFEENEYIQHISLYLQGPKYKESISL